jgi:hypothetical protein
MTGTIDLREKKKHQDFFSPKSAHVSTGLPSPCPVGPGAMVMVVICVMVKPGKQRMMALQSLISCFFKALLIFVASFESSSGLIIGVKTSTGKHRHLSRVDPLVDIG